MGQEPLVQPTATDLQLVFLLLACQGPGATIQIAHAQRAPTHVLAQLDDKVSEKNDGRKQQDRLPFYAKACAPACSCPPLA